MRSKSKFDKDRCKSCIYRMESTLGYNGLVCNYAGVTGHTCLKRIGKEVVDARGEDECQLYKRGKRAMTKSESFRY